MPFRIFPCSVLAAQEIPEYIHSLTRDQNDGATSTKTVDDPARSCTRRLCPWRNFLLARNMFTSGIESACREDQDMNAPRKQTRCQYSNKEVGSEYHADAVLQRVLVYLFCTSKMVLASLVITAFDRLIISISQQLPS